MEAARIKTDAVEQEAWKEATTFDNPVPDPGAVFDLIRTANGLPLTDAALDRQASKNNTPKAGLAQSPG